MEDDDSVGEVEKVEHYLESPEKEPKKDESVEKHEVEKEIQKTHAETCNLHLQNNKEIDTNILEEKFIEVINLFTYTYFWCAFLQYK